MPRCRWGIRIREQRAEWELHTAIHAYIHTYTCLYIHLRSWDIRRTTTTSKDRINLKARKIFKQKVNAARDPANPSRATATATATATEPSGKLWFPFSFRCETRACGSLRLYLRPSPPSRCSASLAATLCNGGLVPAPTLVRNPLSQVVCLSDCGKTLKCACIWQGR